MDDNEVMVSVICNTYNQSEYIQNTLSSLVIQKTNFIFEVLVHDDASNDGTKEIIQEFMKQYPDIIYPYFQKENQYSQNVKITDEFQLPRARGKYVAYCEGDDYWIDEYKLQKQFDQLEKNKHIHICATGAYKNYKGKKVGKIAPAEINKVFTVEDIILGGGAFVATASLMIKKDILKIIPAYREKISIDYLIQIQGAIPEGLLYLSDITCVYRVLSNGSWTKSMKSNVKKNITFTKNLINALMILDKCTNMQYHNIIKKRLMIDKFSLLSLEKDYRKMMSIEYREVLRMLPLLLQIKVFIKSFFYNKRKNVEENE